MQNQFEGMHPERIRQLQSQNTTKRASNKKMYIRGKFTYVKNNNKTPNDNDTPDDTHISQPITDAVSCGNDDTTIEENPIEKPCKSKKVPGKGKKVPVKSKSKKVSTNNDNEDENCDEIQQKPDNNRLVLTIDVGLKNLAMCIMDSEYNVHLWDVYNVLDEEQYSYSCKTRQKDGKMCEKKCQFKFPCEVKKQVLTGECIDDITGEKKNVYTNVTTTEIVHSCKRHCPKDIVTQKKYFIKEKKVGDFLLQDIAERIMKSINDIYNTNIELFSKLTNICIELQPKVNQRMKFTSHIIYAKFVDLYKDYNGEIPIRFIRASQNLQAYRGPPVECKLKTPYAKRKYLSVAYTKWYLEHDLLNTEFNKSKNYLEFLLSHPKKDDLCDVSNANINVHKGLKKKQKQNKNGSEIK
jgi:hypothetical protein